MANISDETIAEVKRVRLAQEAKASDLSMKHLEASERAYKLYSRVNERNEIDDVLGKNVLDELFRRAKLMPELLEQCIEVSAELDDVRGRDIPGQDLLDRRDKLRKAIAKSSPSL